MSDPTEIELKLEVAPEDRERLQASPLIGAKRRKAEHLVSTYFDTPDLALHDAGYSLRIRRQRSKRTQTLKVDRQDAAGLFVRSEWECAVSSDTPVIDGSAGPLSHVLDADDRGKLARVFVTDVHRAVRMIAHRAADIECAVDLGEIHAGDRRQPLCEIELELRGGSPAALFDLARQLNEEVPLRLGVRSKPERGFALAEGHRAAALKATPILLDHHGAAADAFQAIARSCMRQFRLNETLLLSTGRAEPLHQARVGIRRLRSAFSVFKPLIGDDPRAALLAAELRWLAYELGQVRNLDVLIPRVPAEVRHQVVAAREHALSHVRASLASARTRLLMIDLAEWLALGDWMLHPSDPAALRTKVDEFAAAMLDRCRHRMAIRGRAIGDLGDKRRHRLRIGAKKLRYATEFFASLYQGKKARHRHVAFLETLEEMQDSLGELNDRATGPALLATLGIDTELAPGEKRKTLIARAEAAHATLLAAERFWR